ncbi:MAG: hypothetical protein EHM67_15495 [Hyphomicrobiaceae bacterium]|nr:MAG: hypothetical protein EHM67_15495 [Hyphomicrobiaceae bacterium]
MPGLAIPDYRLPQEIYRREVAAMQSTPKDALRGGLRCSLSAFTAMHEGRPVAMLGVVPVAMLGSHGRVWLLGTNDLFNHTRDFLRLGPQVLPFWMKTFKRIDNIVSVENEGAIRMLRRWNFSIGSDVHMHGELAFVPFWMERVTIQGMVLAA